MKKQFLIIDDDRVTVFLHSAIIKSVEPTAILLEFTKPKDAINYFTTQLEKELVSTIVLLDLNMPVISGWEVLDILKDLPFHIRKHLYIFIVSSSLSDFDFQKATEHPLVIEYLLKPLHNKRIENAIEYVNKQQKLSK